MKMRNSLTVREARNERTLRRIFNIHSLFSALLFPPSPPPPRKCIFDVLGTRGYVGKTTYFGTSASSLMFTIAQAIHKDNLDELLW